MNYTCPYNPEVMRLKIGSPACQDPDPDPDLDHPDPLEVPRPHATMISMLMSSRLNPAPLRSLAPARA